jgi:hypothetical protein
MITRITFVGEDHWAEHLARGLNARFPHTVICTAVRLQADATPLLVGLSHLLHDDVIVRVGFPPPLLGEYDAARHADHRGPREGLKRALFRTLPGRALRKAVLYGRLSPGGRRRHQADRLLRSTRWLRPHRREVLYWIGTDALTTMQRAAAGTLGPATLRELARFTHLAVAAHLVPELATVGIAATVVPFPGTTLDVPAEVPPMPEEMIVLTYVPDGRRDFYGLPAILAAARALPDVRFRVLRGEGVGLADVPPNVEFLGYVRDVSAEFAGASVLVRSVQHDGDGSTVAEGLLFARPVLYTYELPHGTQVPWGDADALTAALRSLREQHLAGGIPLDLAGREWALETYDVDRRFGNLRAALLGG